MLDYSARIDKAELTAETLRVPADELAAAHRAGRSRISGRRSAASATTSSNFRRAILHRRRDASTRPRRQLSAAALSAARSGRHLRAGRRGGVSVDRADDGRAGPGGRRAANWPWSLRPRSSAPTTPTCWPRATSWALAKSIAWAGPRRWRRWPMASRACRRVDKIVGPGNLFVALAKKTRLWRRRHRLDRRAQRSGRDRRRLDAARFHGRRSDRPGRTCARAPAS